MKKKMKTLACDCPATPSISTTTCTSSSGQKYPWPTNNKLSVPPSPEYSKIECSKPRKSSHHSNKPEKECKPDCANRRKLYKYPDSSPCQKPKCPLSVQRVACLKIIHLAQGMLNHNVLVYHRSTHHASHAPTIPVSSLCHQQFRPRTTWP